MPLVRPYRSSDRPACLAVFRTNVPRFFRAHEEADFAAFIDAGEAPYLVLERCGAVVGCGGYGVRARADAADLCWGMVAADAHGERLGEYLLVARLAAIARETDAVAVRLVTSQHTDGFFARYGFRVVARDPDGLAEGLEAVEMRMALTPARRGAIRRRAHALLTEA